jgi:serine/threonine-protein kinase
LEEQRGRFGDRTWAVLVLAQAARGLGALHDAGVVHRDLKPANVLTSGAHGPALVVKIADFGLSRVHEPLGDGPVTTPPPAEPTLVASGSVPPVRPMASPRVLTQTGTFLGTPHYMAPEQSGGSRHVGPSADVFAFGVMAYEMLCGRPPFKAPPVYDRLAGRSIDVPPSIGLACPDLSADLTLLVDRALAEDPTKRPSMHEFCLTLSAVAVPPSSGRAKLG